jgi:hypothetical protein
VTDRFSDVERALGLAERGVTRKSWFFILGFRVAAALRRKGGILVFLKTHNSLGLLHSSENRVDFFDHRAALE